jgi:single-stranded-DNA-specific exonuclease
MSIIYTKEALFEELQARHLDNPIKSLKDLPSPYTLRDLQKASQRIKAAIDNKEKICIVGDYDVDGIVSSAIMKDFFAHCDCEVDTIIPNRFKHGYGLSPKIIEEIKDRFDSDLIITVDNGISSIEAGELCEKYGITLIITDHHTVPQTLPKAYAIINPKQNNCEFEYSEICGAQVAWYLCAGIKKELGLSIDMSKFLDLLTIATIADIMPMVGLNHTMVKSGFKALINSKRESIKVLLNSLNNPNDLCSSDIGFMIAPKLNSAGRLSDAVISLEFLLSSTQKEAVEGLNRLEALNNERKELQNSIFAEAVDMVEQDNQNIDNEILVVASPDWHEGVIGIVASKLVERYGKPAFVLSINDEFAKGSARSLDDINLYDLLTQFAQKDDKLLIGFGGHKLAAGLKLKAENIDDFTKSINQIYFENKSNSDDLEDTKENNQKSSNNIKNITLEDIGFELYDMVQGFEPYGLGNEKPLFRLENISIKKIKYVGKDSAHLLFEVYNKDNMSLSIKAIHFNTIYELNNNQTIDLLFEMNKSTFRGQCNIELFVRKIEIRD